MWQCTMCDPAPYASAFFAPTAYEADTSTAYRRVSLPSMEKERTVRTEERASCATSLAAASAFWYRFESRLTSLP